MKPLNRLILQVASILLTIVSMVFTVLLWSQLPEKDWMKFISGLAGFSLELCKFSLLPFSIVLLKNRKTINAGALLMFFNVSLFVVSIGASVAFLENGEQSRQRQGAVWQSRQTTLEQLDQRIAIGQASAAKDGESSYPNIRERGLNTLLQVEQWQEQRQALLDKPVTEESGAIGLDESKRFYAWLLLAILIDGCAAAGWVILSQEEKIASSNDVKELDNSELINNVEERLEAFLRTQKNKVNTDNVLLKVSQPDEKNKKADIQMVESLKEMVTTKETETDEMVSKKTKTKLMVVEREMLDRITSGEHGELITCRGLMKAEKIGYVKAKQILDGLEDDGVLVDTGKGFQLAQAYEDQQSLSYV